MSPQAKSTRRSEGRSAAEWATLLVSAGIVVGLLALVALQFDSDREVRIAVTPQSEQIREADGSFYLPLKVVNEGGPTALDVAIRVTSAEESVEIMVEVLAGGGSEEVVAVFRSRPTQLDARVISFKVP